MPQEGSTSLNGISEQVKQKGQLLKKQDEFWNELCKRGSSTSHGGGSPILNGMKSLIEESVKSQLNSSESDSGWNWPVIALVAALITAPIVMIGLQLFTIYRQRNLQHQHPQNTLFLPYKPLHAQDGSQWKIANLPENSQCKVKVNGKTGWIDCSQIAILKQR